MEIIHSILNPEFKLENSTTLTIGNFDGVHRGHISIIEEIITISKKNNTIPVVVTFDPHPLSIVAPEKIPRFLTNTREKLKLLETYDVPVVVLIPFDRKFSQYSAGWFVDEVLIKKLRAKHIIIGVNHAFGRDRKGDVDFLKNVLPGKGIKLDVVKPIRKSGEMVSSSAVRWAIMGGDFDDAIRMLGHPYVLSGTIISGKGVGKTLGYPTINIQVEEQKLLPPSGVYACSVEHSGETVGGMLYIGTRPTFAGKSRTIEISCFCALKLGIGDYIEIHVLKYFRADIKFESKELLKKQLEKDEKTISSFLNRNKIKLTILNC